jgi:Holliday junction resolvasome RuvABC endonuclease subunit
MIHENMELFDALGNNGNEYYIGMDFSLTSTGVVVLDKYGNLMHNESIATSAKDGTTAERLQMVVDKLDRVFRDWPPRGVAWESINVGTHIKSLMDLSRVSGAMFRVMHEHSQGDYDTPYLLMCNVSTLKKAAAGVDAKKGHMLMEVLDKWGHKMGTDDEADAFVAAKLAQKTPALAEVYWEAFEASDEEPYRFLLDLVKMRNEGFIEAAAKHGIDQPMLESMLNIFTGSRKGGSGLKQMQENNKDFYYEARERLKEL